MDTHSDAWKRAVAEAVHRAVTRDLGPDAVWNRCLAYAIAGCHALRASGHEADIVIGELALIPDPGEDLVITFNPDAPGEQWYKSGRFHAWLAVAGGIADFSARHHRILAERTAMNLWNKRIIWRQPDPPPYIWGWPAAWPDYVRYRASPQATAKAQQRLARMPSSTV